jgi:hypothetical protein
MPARVQERGIADLSRLELADVALITRYISLDRLLGIISN